MTKEKPYNTLTEYYNKKYGHKVAKVALNANFTCPNIDGKKGYGGCIYCHKGSGDFAGDKLKSFEEQYYEVKKALDKKWDNLLYIPYLQANSNTYSNIKNLEKIYMEVIEIDKENTIGISIATRADCINEEIVNLLDKINKIKPVEIELGLQTSNELTSKLINRCETNLEFINAVKLLREKNIPVVVHIINGLPYETKTDMLNTIDFINNLDIQGIKIHSLLILKDTKLYNMYIEKPFNVLTLEEYVEITSNQIARLKDSIIIHRLQADSSLDDIYLPLWPYKKMVVMNEIDKYMRKNNLYQGKYYIKNPH